MPPDDELCVVPDDEFVLLDEFEDELEPAVAVPPAFVYTPPAMPCAT